MSSISIGSQPFFHCLRAVGTNKYPSYWAACAVDDHAPLSALFAQAESYEDDPNSADDEGRRIKMEEVRSEFPAGFSTPSTDAPLGVPVGMELLGRSWAEPELIELAFGFEQATHLRRPPVSTPAF